MKTKDEITTQFVDELSGRLTKAFAEAESRRLAGDGGGTEKDAAAVGRFMVGQLRWAREFLGRVAEFAADVSPAKPAANGVPQPQQKAVVK
jgi:hypothetical protein